MTHLNAQYHSQTGATLLIVLVVILFLATVSVMAIRGSQTALDMTTSAQVNKLLVQSSDVPLAKLEMANIDKDRHNKPLIKGMEEGSGPIGTLQIEGNKDDEFILCYQPIKRESLFEGANKHRILTVAGTATWNKATRGSADGYCKISDKFSGFFTSGRKTVASQVSLTRPTVNQSTTDDVQVKPLSAANLGMDESSINVETSTYFRAYVTSVLPSLSISSNDKKIDKCLQLPMGGIAGDDNQTNQEKCLSDTNTPMNIQVQDFVYNLNAK